LNEAGAIPSVFMKYYKTAGICVRTGRAGQAHIDLFAP